MLDGIIKHVDTRTGEAKCAFVKHKLRYTHDDQVYSYSFLCDVFTVNILISFLFVQLCVLFFEMCVVVANLLPAVLLMHLVRNIRAT